MSPAISPSQIIQVVGRQNRKTDGIKCYYKQKSLFAIVCGWKIL